MSRAELSHDAAETYGVPFPEGRNVVGPDREADRLLGPDGRPHGSRGGHTSGIPDEWEPRPGRLSVVEREQILISLGGGESLAAIVKPRVWWRVG